MNETSTPRHRLLRRRPPHPLLHLPHLALSKDMNRKVRSEVFSARFAHAKWCASLKKRIPLTAGQFQVTFVTCTACDSWRLSYCTDVTTESHFVLQTNGPRHHIKDDAHEQYENDDILDTRRAFGRITHNAGEDWAGHNRAGIFSAVAEVA